MSKGIHGYFIIISISIECLAFGNWIAQSLSEHYYSTNEETYIENFKNLPKYIMNSWKYKLDYKAT